MEKERLETQLGNLETMEQKLDWIKENIDNSDDWPTTIMILTYNHKKLYYLLKVFKSIVFYDLI